MATKNEQATIVVRPVSWAGDKVLKMQAYADYGKKRIIGDPKPTTEEAVESLYDEIKEWYSAVVQITARYEKEFPKTDVGCQR